MATEDKKEDPVPSQGESSDESDWIMPDSEAPAAPAAGPAAAVEDSPVEEPSASGTPTADAPAAATGAKFAPPPRAEEKPDGAAAAAAAPAQAQGDAAAATPTASESPCAAAASEAGADAAVAKTAGEAQQLKFRTEIAMEHAAVKPGTKQVQAVLSVVAPCTDGEARAPLRLVAVLDKSGSMTGDKLRLVKQTTLMMLGHLSDRDSLGIVEYDTQVRVTAPLTYCTLEGRSKLEAALARLQAGTQTNLSGGLLKGIELHEGKAPRQVAPLQPVDFGNRYERLKEAPAETFGKAPSPPGAERVHQWTMELRCKRPADAACVEKVVYRLHETFAERVVEVREPPFALKRHGWGTFRIFADVHLKDGRVLQVHHDLSFSQPETFRTHFLELKSEERPSASSGSGQEAAMVRSTFLFTDGLANAGITGSKEICAAAAGALDELEERRCTLSTFGFGKDHDADLLQGLAEKGAGIYSYVESEDQIGSAFGEALGGLLSTTHQNVNLCLELRPGVSLVKAHTPYTVDTAPREEDGTQSISIDIGDLFAEERRDILVTLKLPGEAECNGLQPIGHLRAKGFAVSACRSERTDPCDLCLEWRADVEEGAAPHPQVMRHRNRILATEALDAARAAARTGDLTGARRLLQGGVTTLQASPLTTLGDMTTTGMLVDLQTCLGDMEDQATFESYGSKKMACMKGSHATQRACYGQDFSATYSNATMRTMKANFKAGVQ